MKGILPVKFGRPRGMTSRRLRLLLEQSRTNCCKARNAIVTHWFLWWRANPTWTPGGKYDAPKRKIKRKKSPSAKAPKDPPYAPREFISRELYDAARQAAPTLNTSVVSSCVQDVIDKLRSKKPYTLSGDMAFFWQAVLSSAVSLPTWQGGRIPLPRSVSKLTYDDHECTLRVPLLSKASGYRVLSPVVELAAGDLKAGNRRILRRLASGDLRLADSQIVEIKGKWYAQLCYDVPVNAVDLSLDRVLVVSPGLPEARRPFACSWTVVGDDGKEHVARWELGDGIPYFKEYERVQARRFAIKKRYSDGCGSGHGRKRWFKAMKPMSRVVIDMEARFTKQLVADIVKLAIREQCGTVLFREPSMPVRDMCWFAEHDVPFNWSQFATLQRDRKTGKLKPTGRLAFSCEKAGLNLEIKRIRMAEWRPKEK